MTKLIHRRINRILTKFAGRLGNSQKRIKAEQEIEHQFNVLYTYFNKRGFQDVEIYQYLSNKAEIWVLMHKLCGKYNHKIELDNLSQEEKYDRIDDICYHCDEKFTNRNKNYLVQNYEYVLKYPIKVQARSKDEALDRLDNDYLTGDFNNNRLRVEDMMLSKVTFPTREQEKYYLEEEAEIEGMDND